MKVVCLANSYKTGGRCIAGIELDDNNDVVLVNGKPKWVRPVSNNENHEIANELVEGLLLLDIFEIDEIVAASLEHQTENVSFDQDSIEVIGEFDIANLHEITDNGRYGQIFGNGGAAVHADVANDLDYSLILLELSIFEVVLIQYEGRVHPKVKLKFRYNGHEYSLPITDPVFLDTYGHNRNILQDKEIIHVSISLARAYEEWCYKLVAGIMY